MCKQNSQRNYTFIPCHERLQECRGVRTDLQPQLRIFLPYTFFLLVLNSWMLLRRHIDLLQPLPVCPGQYFMLFSCFVREFMHFLIFLIITKFFVRNRNFSYTKSSTQEFIPLLPYPLPHYRIQFLQMCFLKSFPHYSRKSFSRKKYETSDGLSAFCSPRSQQQEIQSSVDSDLCDSCQLFSGPSNPLGFTCSQNH